jgi:hypothetical protein
MSKNFVSVGPHRRAFPKRKFADGGASAAGRVDPGLPLGEGDNIDPGFTRELPFGEGDNIDPGSMRDSPPDSPVPSPTAQPVTPSPSPENTLPTTPAAKPKPPAAKPATSSFNSSAWLRALAGAGLGGGMGVGALSGAALGLLLPLIWKSKRQPMDEKPTPDKAAKGGPIGAGMAGKRTMKFQAGGVNPTVTPGIRNFRRARMLGVDPATVAGDAAAGPPPAASPSGFPSGFLSSAPPSAGAASLARLAAPSGGFWGPGGAPPPGAMGPPPGVGGPPSGFPSGFLSAPGTGPVPGGPPPGGPPPGAIATPPGGSSMVGMPAAGGSSNMALDSSTSNPQQMLAAMQGQMRGMGGPPPGAMGPGAGGPPPGGMAGPGQGLPPGMIAALLQKIQGAGPGGLQAGFMPPGGGMPVGAPPPAPPMATGGPVPYRKGGFANTDATAENLPPAPVKKARAAFTRKPKGPAIAIAITHKKPAPVSTPSPYDYENDEGTAPPPPAPPMAKGGAATAKAKGGTIKKNKGGECDEKMAKGGIKKAKGGVTKLAAGGAAKQRRGFPNTLPPPKRLASGGTVRGCGAATKGRNFSGIY